MLLTESNDHRLEPNREPQRGAVGGLGQSALEPAHHFRLGEDVPFHCRFDHLLGRTWFQAEFAVEGVQLEVVAMRLAGRRAGSAVSRLVEVVLPLDAAARDRFRLRHSFRKLAGAGRKVIGHPMHPRADGRVGIVGDQCETLRSGRRLVPAQRRRNIRTRAGVLGRDVAARLKRS